MKFVLEQTQDNYEQMGEKATTLVKMQQVVDDIPRWFVVSHKGFNLETKDIEEEAKNEIEEELKDFPASSVFAIRPSAINKDHFENQYQSILAVKKENVIEKIKEIYLSAISEEANKYREENNIYITTIPSVIVQKMVNSERAGYAFGANPETSNVKEIIIKAVYGLGNQLKTEKEKLDTYTISNDNIEKNIERKYVYNQIENGEVVTKKLDKKITKRQITSKEEILQIKDMVEKAGELFGRFQKVEWAVEGEKIYLINSEPITTLVSPQSKEVKPKLKENNEIVKKYEGITTPLTFSFIKTVYENMYVKICEIFNVEKEKIEINSQMFKNILALIDGRVYYNINGWYEMLEMFPELGKTKIYMEPIMGVNEFAPMNLLPVVQESNFKEKIEVMKNKYDVFRKTNKVKKITDKFNSRVNDIIKRKNIKNMNLEELHDYYYEIERKILARWDAPLINEFLATIFQKRLKEICIKYFQDEATSIQNDLLCIENGIICTDMAQRIKEMAELARYDRSLLRLLEKDDILYIKKNLIQYSNFYDAINEYLELYSDRSIHELKLETQSLKENPLNLYHAIAALARRMRDEKVEYIDYESINIKAEEKIKSIKFLGKAKLEYNLKYARYTVENRELLRYERTRVFGKIRELFLRIGLILTSMDVLEEKRDVLYLEVEEVLDYIAGKSTINNLKELVRLRKEQYEKYSKEQPIEKTINTTNAEVKELNGIGASTGIARGRIKVVSNIENAEIRPGEILVAEYSDPGWIMVFPKVEGIILEKEKITSEAAIVAKELGIPIIVGVKDLLQKVKDGERVEFDAKTGKIKKI